MSRRPSIQIVVPSLNQGRFIAEAVGSVLAQSGDVALELTVMDAVSEDDTLAEIARAVPPEKSDLVTVVSEPDEGQSQAINKGVQRGSSDVVSWLNADDRLLPGALDHVARAYADAPEDVVAAYGHVRFIDEAGAAAGEVRAERFDRRRLLFGPNYVPQTATFIRRRAWEAVGGLREHLHYAMDFDLWLRLSEIGRLVALPDFLAEFRLHATSKTGSGYDKMRREAMTVRKEHASKILGRTPSTLELRGRLFAARCERRVRRTLA